MKKLTYYNLPTEVTSSKIKKLERQLEKIRTEKPIEQRIKEKEEFLEFMVSAERSSRDKKKSEVK